MDPDPLVIGLDPHQNVTDPQHWIHLYRYFLFPPSMPRRQKDASIFVKFSLFSRYFCGLCIILFLKCVLEVSLAEPDPAVASPQESTSGFSKPEISS